MRIRVEQNSVPEEDCPIRLSHLNCNYRILATGDGYQHVVLADQTRSIQLLCDGKPVLDPDANLVIQLDRMRFMNLKRGSLRRFLLLYREASIRDEAQFETSTKQQMRNALMVFDGKRSGLSNRNIAVALYGEDRVKTEWPGRSGPLRARVRRLIQAGNQIVNGGYLQLLK